MKGLLQQCRWRSLGGISCTSRVVREFHVAAALAAPALQFQPISYRDTEVIKQERLARGLEEFKEKYEEPVARIFQTVWETRRRMGNRRSRAIMPKLYGAKVFRKREMAERKKEFYEKEKVVESQMQTYLMQDRNLMRSEDTFFYADTPEKRLQREHFLGFMFNNFWDISDPNSEWSTDNPPPKLKMDNLRNKYNWEKTLSEGEIARIITNELESEGVTCSMDGFLNRYEEQGKKTSTLLQLDKDTTLPTMDDRPAVAIAKKGNNKQVKPKIQKVSNNLPIAFETNYYPNDEMFYDPYHTRKVIMYVKVSALDLPKNVKSRLLAIANQRGLYEMGKDLLIIKSQKKRTKRLNKHYVVQILRALLLEAWKADLNYIPGKEQLLPHQAIEYEMKAAQEREQKEYQDSFDRIKEKQHWTIFRVKSFPAEEEWTKAQSEALQFYKKCEETLTS
eukprot:TRINITY_DN2730_c0_g1_i1.p1 TRINITY_DN2730_c0_g1~~TRINITY_DN2730_c0_g1_i1.p1  ORF type:complete len:449 (+),score=97.36 TRINITY_DN2730_c0_g1_i1:32-1378(+)